MNILAHCASKLQSKKIPNKPPRKSKHCNSALLFQLQRRIILNYDFSSTPSATTDLSSENSIQTIQFRVMLQIYPTFQQRLSLNISIRRSNAAFVFFAANIKQFILICHCALALLHDTSTKYLIHLKNVTRKKKRLSEKYLFTCSSALTIFTSHRCIDVSSSSPLRVCRLFFSLSRAYLLISLYSFDLFFRQIYRNFKLIRQPKH